jgi:uncharacterized protein (DUF433 family)
VPPSTLHYWLEGGERRGKTYKPIIRIEPKGGRAPVTWAEFVEAGLLRQYRRGHQVPMAELRSFIDDLRQRSGIPYPLADQRPYVGAGRELVIKAQDTAGLDPDYCLVAQVRGQYVLTGPSEAFIERVGWDGNVAASWRPHDDRESPVRMSPDVRFGRPAVGGVSTEVLWEHSKAGEDVEDIAVAFDLEIAQVTWALSYESPRRAA